MTSRGFDLHVPSECSWELTCTCLLAIHSAFRRGRSLTIMRWLLPVGWLTRLEASLYVAYHELEDAGVVSFKEQREDSSRDYILAYSEGSSGFPIRDASQLIELLHSREFAADRLFRRLSSNRSRLAKWRGRHVGKRAFVIGNGPSLARTDLRTLSNELTFGSNALFLLDRRYRFRPTFYAVEDRLVAEDRAEEIQAYQGPTKFFPWDQEPALKGYAYLPLVRNYAPYPQFSFDVSEAVFTGWTVTFILLQLAFYMGIRRVFLVGVDGTYPRIAKATDNCVVLSTSEDTNHFVSDYFGPGRRYHLPQPQRVTQAYILARERFQAAGGGIWNATVGGELDIFPRVDLAQVLEAKE